MEVKTYLQGIKNKAADGSDHDWSEHVVAFLQIQRQGREPIMVVTVIIPARIFAAAIMA